VRSLTVACAVVVVVASFARVADAASAPVLVSLDYQTATECPSEDAFTEKLSARSASVQVVRGEEGAQPQLFVRVTRKPAARLHGELVVRYPDGSEARRTVDGDTCSSVIDALALMSAMTLDPSVSSSGPTTPPHKPEPSDAVPRPTDVPPPDTTARPPLDESKGIHLAVGAGGGAVFGIAPVAAPSAAVFAELSWRTGGFASPSVRAGFDYATSADTSVAGGSVQMARSDFSLDGCPFRWSVGAWRFTPCVRVEAGALAASGVGVSPDRSATRPWFASGVAGAVQYRISQRFFLELTGGVRAPLVRDRFFFEPNPSTIVFEAPVLSGFCSATAGLTIL